MLLFPVRASVFQERRREVDLDHRDFPQTKGGKPFIEIGIHEFDDVKGRLATELFNGKRVDMTEDCVERILVDEPQLLQFAFFGENITQLGMVVF